ncbi:hypothetical protein LshimejAT787_0204340 [Lyophyllum shimeji]|uniref:Uncharacterized protein n=1 Tax=Lyophyllum shimeji TaxID=47721 RepID=A0A9P3UI33_LYOSH|nr:hypothetical protein LshimejAT787_0204340 [Lyophyllum shimeji]
MARLPAPTARHDSNPRAVNNLLHTLRGEHFRHAQNLQKSRSHLSASTSRSSPTLPIDLTTAEYSSDDPASSKSATSPSIVEDTPAWRARAVSLVLPPPPSIPLLTNLCLRILAALPAQDFTQDVIPYIPPHLRRDLVRHAAIHSPLSSSKLFALCEPDGHTDTELIVVGPNATLPDDYFIRTTRTEDSEDTLGDAEDGSWDSERGSGSDPLSTFVLMSTPLATSWLLSLPPTITRMALINLPTPISLHRLPTTCPLLVTLDLSYNTWLSPGSDTAEKVLERVDWSRWNYLRTLGLRECHVSSEMLVKLNRGRWDDVDVVQ